MFARCIFAIFLFAGAFASEGRDISIDLRAQQGIGNNALLSLVPKKSDAGVLRKSRLAAGAAKTDALAVGDRLTFLLYDDVELVVTLVEREDSVLTGNTFQAVVDGSDGVRNATVIESADGLVVNITERERVYSVISTPDGVTVSEYNPSAEPTSCAGAVVPDLGVQSEDADSEPSIYDSQPVLLAVSDQPSTIVDVLVAYDAPAAVWANRDGGGITNYAQQAVAKMNSALINNSLDSTFRFRLVGVIAVAANGNGDFERTLYAVKDAESGWEAIAAKRNEVGADVVTTMIDTGSAYGTTGLGFSLIETAPGRVSAFADWAYNVVSVRAVAISHTMTHETGHNMGAGHADAQRDGPGPQSWPYSSGYYFTGMSGERFHTIMAYANDGYGNHYVEAPLFSSATAGWDGVVAGDSERHDNERVLRSNYQRVSQFRSQIVPMSYDVFFTPESGALFSGVLAVDLVPGKAGEQIRYTVDGSTPTETHGYIYDTPIHISEMTTIKAVVVTAGVAGPVYSATYYPSNIGTALGVPELVWRNSDDMYPWIAQDDETFDGELAVVSSPLEKDLWEHSTALSTVRTGPATKMSFRYKTMMYASDFAVYVDDIQFWSESTRVDEWNLAEIDIPEGRHVIEFRYTQRGYYYDPTFCGVWIDDIRFDALSRAPTMTPPCEFFAAMTVMIVPTSTDGRIFYTLDGSDPEGEGAILYTNAFTITKSTMIRAIEVDPGKNASVEIGGLFRERHPIEPGEWTEDVEGVKSAALANGGKLICVVSLDDVPGSSSEAFCNLARSLTFRNWARANDVYLLMADKAHGVEYDTAIEYFNTLRSSYGDAGPYYYTQLYFATPSNSNTTCAQGEALVGRYIGNEEYQGTMDSLTSGFGSVLAMIGHMPETYWLPTEEEILGTHGISWENGSYHPWFEEYPGKLRIGGRRSDTYTSTLRATVSGKGLLIYSYRFNTWTSQNIFVFPTDEGRISRTYSPTLGAEQSGTVTNHVTSSGTTTFEWDYIVGDGSRDYGAGYSSQAGVWLYDVKWVPAKCPAAIILK